MNVLLAHTDNLFGEKDSEVMRGLVDLAYSGVDYTTEGWSETVKGTTLVAHMRDKLQLLRNNLSLGTNSRVKDTLTGWITSFTNDESAKALLDSDALRNSVLKGRLTKVEFRTIADIGVPVMNGMSLDLISTLTNLYKTAKVAYPLVQTALTEYDNLVHKLLGDQDFRKSLETGSRLDMRLGNISPNIDKTISKLFTEKDHQRDILPIQALVRNKNEFAEASILMGKINELVSKDFIIKTKARLDNIKVKTDLLEEVIKNPKTVPTSQTMKSFISDTADVGNFLSSVMVLYYIQLQLAGTVDKIHTAMIDSLK